MHGWGITQRIAAMSGDTLLVQQGSLYASLHRLTREGSDHLGVARYRPWAPGSLLRRRHAGERQLEAEIGYWQAPVAGRGEGDRCQHLMIVIR